MKSLFATNSLARHISPLDGQSCKFRRSRIYNFNCNQEPICPPLTMPAL